MAKQVYGTRISGPSYREANRVVIADENYTITADDECIEMSTTGAGGRTLTLGSGARPGRMLKLCMKAFSTGTYTTVNLTLGNQMLFNAAGQSATLIALDDGTWAVQGVGLPAPTRP